MINPITLTTPRLTLSPLTLEDVHDLHDLRSREEVMKWSLKGHPDADLPTTQTWLTRFLSPEITPDLGPRMCYAIRITDSPQQTPSTTTTSTTSKGKFIGTLGIHAEPYPINTNTEPDTNTYIHRNNSSDTQPNTKSAPKSGIHTAPDTNTHGDNASDTKRELDTVTDGHNPSATDVYGKPGAQAGINTASDTSPNTNPNSNTNITTTNHPKQIFEIGYMLHPTAWGKGYASEAVRAVTEKWFSGDPSEGADMRLLREVQAKERPGVEVERGLFGIVNQGNEGSVGVLRKMGFGGPVERVVEGDGRVSFVFWREN
ncbi:GNAT family N-acetyltransferase [Aspergillus ibericus CBS 121593]|uniref:N-acetyltransferase domain-containing protein n=1 Tax=Aspergillus ibericus CBS 121593 TaxID=1448316 RepID=A0A395HCH4_9EURO|nr:hypothetical protein BO80DRAFT_421531 [Aspergillus ibericus CBS 121593]RAL05502.1 hypothetical protein BO80DRAFT_421531 [Aspergillus ibericus CBS 121593]